jgi:hypothetical protein
VRVAGIITALLALVVCIYWTYAYVRRRLRR